MSFQSTYHHFNVEEAVKFGTDSAVLLNNIRFWLEKNKANKKHIHDGFYWTYNSAKAFAEMFPYMSKQSISRHLKNLCNEGVLIAGTYNEKGYDRTMWYSIPSEFAISQNETAISQNETAISQNETAISQNETAIPDSKPDNKQQIVNTNKEKGENAKSAFVEPEPEKPKVKAEKPKPYYETVELPSFIDRQLFLDWHEMRIVKNGNGKAKLTENAVNLQIKRLSALEQDGYPANQCLLILSETGWLGVTPEGCIKQINESRNRNAQKSPNSATNTSQGLQVMNSGINYGTQPNQRPAFRDFAQEKIDRQAQEFEEMRMKREARKAKEASIVLSVDDYQLLQTGA